jgi:integrase
MSRAIKVAVVRKRTGRNPCSNVTPPAATRGELELPTAAEVERILEACREWPNGARWVLALRTGLRQGEALALRWSDVTLAAPASVTVRRSAARVKEGLMYKQPKSARSRRTVPLTAAVVAALRAHKLARGVAAVDGLVFTDPAGQPVHPRADYSDWHALLDSLGIRHYRVHDCRHALATMLLESGTDVRIVQDIMGWSTLAMTEVYQHVRPALAASALDALEMPASVPAKRGARGVTGGNRRARNSR